MGEREGVEGKEETERSPGMLDTADQVRYMTQRGKERGRKRVRVRQGKRERERGKSPGLLDMADQVRYMT